MDRTVHFPTDRAVVYEGARLQASTQFRERELYTRPSRQRCLCMQTWLKFVLSRKVWSTAETKASFFFFSKQKEERKERSVKVSTCQGLFFPPVLAENNSPSFLYTRNRVQYGGVAERVWRVCREPRFFHARALRLQRKKDTDRPRKRECFCIFSFKSPRKHSENVRTSTTAKQRSFFHLQSTSFPSHRHTWTCTGTYTRIHVYIHGNTRACICLQVHTHLQVPVYVEWVTQ